MAVRVLAVLALLIWLGWLLPQAASRIPGETALSSVRQAVVSPSVSLVTPGQWNAALRNLRRAGENVAGNAEYFGVASNLHRVAAVLRPDLSDDERAAHGGLALQFPRAQAALRPADSRAWAAWANTAAIWGDLSPETWRAFSLAQSLAPYDTHVRLQLKEAALIAWTQNQGPEAAGWIERLYLASDPGDRKRMARVAAELGIALSEAGAASSLPSLAP